MQNEMNMSVLGGFIKNFFPLSVLTPVNHNSTYFLFNHFSNQEISILTAAANEYFFKPINFTPLEFLNKKIIEECEEKTVSLGGLR